MTVILPINTWTYIVMKYSNKYANKCENNLQTNGPKHNHKAMK